MPDENLLKYIKDGLAMGRTEDVLRSLLLSAGWTEKDINDAFLFMKNGGQAPVMPVAVTPKEAIPPQIETQMVQQYAPVKRSNIKIIGIIIFVVCVLGAGSAFGYYYLQSQVSPQQVLNKAFAAMGNVKTYSFSQSITSNINIPSSSLSIMGGTKSPASAVLFSASDTGALDLSDLTNIKQSFVLNISASTGTTPIATGQIDYISLDNIFYIKLDNIALGGPTTSAPNPFSTMFQFFIGQWFKIDSNAIKQTFLQYAKASSSSQSLLEAQSSTQLSADKIQQIGVVAAQYPIFTVIQTLSSEAIGGQDMYHYGLDLDKANLKSFIAAAYPIISGQSIPDNQLASTTAALDGITFKDVEIWIGKKDFLPYKISADVTVQQGRSGPINEIQFSDLQSDYNQPVNIIAPEGAKDLNQIISGSMGAVNKKYRSMDENGENKIIPPASAPAGPALVDGSIQSVDQSTLAYFERHPWQVVLCLIFTAIFGVVCAGLFVLNMNNPKSDDGIVLVFLPLIVPFLVYTNAQRRIQDEFMEQFAVANGYTFSPYGSFDGLDGALFRLGNGTRGMHDVVSGQYLSCPVALFDYQYETGYGKQRQMHYYTVFKLQFAVTMPDLLLEKKALFSSDTLLGQLPEHIKLEGDFNKYFTLSIKKGYEVEALEIFTPDVMAELMEKCRGLSLEIVNSHLFIYDNKTISKRVDLYALYDIAQYFVQKLGPVLARMEPDLRAMEQERQ